MAYDINSYNLPSNVNDCFKNTIITNSEKNSIILPKGMKNINNLKITYYPDFTEEQFTDGDIRINDVVKYCGPHLESVVIRDKLIINDRMQEIDNVKFSLVEIGNYKLRLKTDNLTDLFRMLAKYCKNLIHFSVTSLDLNDEIVYYLRQLFEQNVKLEKLLLSDILHISNTLMHIPTSLQELVIHNIHLDSAIKQRFLERIPNLKCLKLYLDYHTILDLLTLARIYIPLLKSLFVKPKSNILQMTDPEIIDKAFGKISEFRNLEELYILKCGKNITTVLFTIAIKCKRLRKLSLKYCIINSVGIGQIIKSPNLEYLDISHLKIVEAFSYKNQWIPKLKHLHINNCKNISDNDIKDLLSSCVNLECLALFDFTMTLEFLKFCLETIVSSRKKTLIYQVIYESYKLINKISRPKLENDVDIDWGNFFIKFHPIIQSHYIKDLKNYINERYCNWIIESSRVSSD